MDIAELLAVNGGVATTGQLLAVLTRKALSCHVRAGRLIRVFRGVYASATPDLPGRLAAVNLLVDEEIVACLGSAAALYGFDTENTAALHVLDPGVRLRPTVGLVVHQRIGAPLQRVAGCLATAPAWTAVEVARTLWRPRALATLDAALHVGACTRDQLGTAVREQAGRRGIVQVRALLELADGRSESPMEGEARLVFIDGGLPPAELQYEIVDRYGDRWRVDFAWPEARLAAEYDSIDWHLGDKALRHDRLKAARLLECGWISTPLTVTDVRLRPAELVARVRGHLDRPLLAG